MHWDEVGREVGKMRRKRALNQRPQRALGLFWVAEETRWEWGRAARGRQEAEKTDSAWGHLVDPISGIQGLLSLSHLYISMTHCSLYQQNMQFHSSTLPPKLVPSPEISQNCVSFIPLGRRHEGCSQADMLLARFTHSGICCFLTHGPSH